MIFKFEDLLILHTTSLKDAYLEVGRYLLTTGSYNYGKTTVGFHNLLVISKTPETFELEKPEKKIYQERILKRYLPKIKISRIVSSLKSGRRASKIVFPVCLDKKEPECLMYLSVLLCREETSFTIHACYRAQEWGTRVLADYYFLSKLSDKISKDSGLALSSISIYTMAVYTRKRGVKRIIEKLRENQINFTLSDRVRELISNKSHI